MNNNYNNKLLLSHNKGDNTANLTENVEIITNNSTENLNNSSIHGKILDNNSSEKYSFLLHPSDILFTLTINPSHYKENVNYLIGKMIVVKEDVEINLSNLSEILGYMKIDKLYIFSINTEDTPSKTNITKVKGLTPINYMELGVENFIKVLNTGNYNFLDYNRDCLYILRNGSYIDIKSILTKIMGYETKLGRGGSQKAHMLSPLDLRLSCYLMAMFNLNHKLISSLNTFNYISKDRYLVYFEQNNNNNN